jgi:hypothetical protein
MANGRCDFTEGNRPDLATPEGLERMHKGPCRRHDSDRVRALIEWYQQCGMKDVSHIFYDGSRHEPLNEFCRDQMHADVVAY